MDKEGEARVQASYRDNYARIAAVQTNWLNRSWTVCGRVGLDVPPVDPKGGSSRMNELYSSDLRHFVGSWHLCDLMD